MPQADQYSSSPASSTSCQAGADTESRPGASKGQKLQSNNPSVSRHRANAAVTAAPARSYSSSPSPVQAGESAQAQGTSATQQPPQPLSDPQQLLHTTTLDLDRQNGTGATSLSSEGPGAKLAWPTVSRHQTEAATEAVSPAEGDTASHRESELETKLSELTNRLSAAEQAAGHSSEIHSQLLQLKEDKAALQADLKQFMHHTSSMLTTLQAQMSRLMGCSLHSTAPVIAENSCTSAASEQSNQGRSETALPAQAQALDSCENISPAISARARGSIHDWHLESHGSQPSPLARHEIFHDAASSPKHTVQQAAHSRVPAGQSGSWMDELCTGMDKRQAQVCRVRMLVGYHVTYVLSCLQMAGIKTTIVAIVSPFIALAAVAFMLGQQVLQHLLESAAH